MIPFVAVCHLLGDYLEGIKKDFDKAAKVYRSNCDDYGYAKSCLKYGNYSFLGKGRASDKGDSLKAYAKFDEYLYANLMNGRDSSAENSPIPY